MEMNGIPFARCSQTADVNKNKVRMAPGFQAGNHNPISLKSHDSFVKFGGKKDPAEEQGVKDAILTMAHGAAKGRFETLNAQQNPTNDAAKRKTIWTATKKEYLDKSPTCGLKLNTGHDPDESEPEYDP